MQKKIPAFLLPLLCGCFLLVFALTLLLSPSKTYSEQENRTLSTAPTLALSSLLDGSYTRELGDFFADQFPLRTAFVRLKTRCEQLLLRSENGGVLFGKDGYLIPRLEYTDAQYATLEQNVQALSRLSERMAQDESTDVPLLLAPVPRSVDVNRSRLPDHYDPGISTAVWALLQEQLDRRAVSSVDLLTSLQQAADQGEDVWFRTDHHWTSEGAYLAYCALGEVLGYQPYARDTFSAEVVSEDFLGTTYSSAGLVAAQADAITLLRYDADTDYRTEIRQNGVVTRTLQGFYDWDALDTKDQYTVFLGGTNSHICVEPPDGQSLPTLLLIKDSYAQSLAPLLARHYRLILIDPRTYRPTDTQPALLSLIKQEQPDAVLVLCGLDTLCGDMDLRTLLVGK